MSSLIIHKDPNAQRKYLCVVRGEHDEELFFAVVYAKDLMIAAGKFGMLYTQDQKYEIADLEVGDVIYAPCIGHYRTIINIADKYVYYTVEVVSTNTTKEMKATLKGFYIWAKKQRALKVEEDEE